MPTRQRKPKSPQKPSPVPWDEHHPARIMLFEGLERGEICLEDVPSDVWSKYWHTNAFQTWGMAYDSTFTRRLRDVKKIFLAGKTRAEQDQLDFNVFRYHHPRPAENKRGDYPHWDGSQAQQRLKMDLDEGLTQQYTPKELYNLPNRSIYRAWPLEIFRGHIHQEKDTRKYLYTLKHQVAKIAQDKLKELDEVNRKVQEYERHQEMLEEDLEEA